MKSTETKRSGIGFTGLLTILFIGLKLTDHIAWSWWVVLLPMWLPLAVGFAIALIADAITVIVRVLK